MARVAAVVADTGLEHELRDSPADAESTRVVTGFVDTAAAFGLSGRELQAEAFWRGEVPQHRAPELIEVCRTLNEVNFMPVIFATAGTQADRLGVCARGRLNVTAGATDEQLHGFITFFLRQTLAVFAKLAQAFPEVVDWSDPHDTHGEPTDKEERA